jgi:hypothetical protein
MAYAKEVEAEQRVRRGARRQAYRDDDGAVDVDDASFDSFDAASAGYPGAWDDEFVELPRAVAR